MLRQLSKIQWSSTQTRATHDDSRHGRKVRLLADLQSSRDQMRTSSCRDNEAARSAARRRTPAGEHDVLRRRKREALLSLLHRPHVQEMLAERVVNVLSQADFHRASLVSSRWWVERPVSYTHLTLPTICSV
eukprot:2603203-Prymnesium_polylepis.1